MFQAGECIKEGCVAVFGDETGKPGDVIYSLLGIENSNGTLAFLFSGGERLQLHNPRQIVANEKVIGVVACEKVERVSKDFNLVYSKENSKIKTAVLKGEHQFRTVGTAVAFVFYSW